MAATRTATIRAPAVPAAPTRTSLWRLPRTRALLLVGAIGAVVGVAGLAARLYTDVLWYREVGQEQVLWTTLGYRALVPAFVGLGTACALLANLAVADRLVRGRARPRPGAMEAVWRRRALLYPLVAVAAGLLELDRHGHAWQPLMLWAHRVDFGVRDPIFHRDVGFFVFSLPLLHQLTGWLRETLALCVAASLGIAALARTRPSRGHVLGLLALLLAATAWRLRLDGYRLALPHGGSPVPGASSTDVAIRLPALRALTFAALAGAVALLYGAVRRVRLAVAAVLAGVALVGIAAANALPPLFERFEVQPQVLSHERPYVADAIAATRHAYALDDVDVRPMAGSGELDAADLAAERDTIANVPLWSARVMRPALDELQAIGGYYAFPSVTLDRYDVDGVPRLLNLGARQLDLSGLDRGARGWTNSRFAYTHGYGVAASEAGGVDRDRYPRFAERDFAGAAERLGLREPRVYFGERTRYEPPYLVLHSRRGEVERPAPGSTAPSYHYDGGGGIALSSLVRRAAFALRFGDLKLLLTSTATDASRIVLHRVARERVRTLAPFLAWDRHPQTVIAGGRVQFLLHGYTTTTSYPYAARVPFGGRRVSYVRASALAAVDAFTGAVTLYALDDEDPILRAWRGAYPTLLRPASEMPSDLRERIRYPARLFAAQARAYERYHADDPTAFWNGGDAWEPPRELAGPVERVGELHFPTAGRDDGRPMDPRRLLVRLPGDAEPSFVLATPFTPRGRQNLSGYLAGSVDDAGRPRLTLLDLPRDRLTVGPSQATRKILASPGVNRRLEILNRESRDLGQNSVNRTVIGAPRLLPIGDALVQVQPVYITAGGTGLPRLQLVTAYANGRVASGPDLMTALRRLAATR